MEKAQMRSLHEVTTAERITYYIVTQKKNGTINTKSNEKNYILNLQSFTSLAVFIMKTVGHPFQNKELLCISKKFNFYND